jgi:C-terminal processing protease CtpA/Prc
MQLGDEIIAVNCKKVNTMKYEEVMNLLHTTQEPVEFHVIKSNLSMSLNSTNTNTNTNTNTSSDCASSCASPLTKSHSIQSTEPDPKQTKLNEAISVDTTTSNHSLKTNLPTSTLNSTPPLPPPIPHNLPSSSKNHKQLTFDLTDQSQSKSPRTAKIRVGEETLIEIERGKLGLGLSIVGGSDTQLPGIIVHDIYQNGAAYRDARLSIGDQILKVNSVDLINATHDQALNALRQTSDYVKLLIHRGYQNLKTPNSTKSPEFGMPIELSATSGYNILNVNKQYQDENFLNILNIDLNKKFAKGLGFSIIGRRDGSGVFVSHLIEGGCAQKDGRLMIGDLILEVNNQDIRKSSYSDVAFLLKTLPQGKVNLKVGRFKTSANVSASNSGNASSCVSPTQVSSNKTSRRNSSTQINKYEER